MGVLHFSGHFPWIISVGGIDLPVHALCEFLGIFIAFRYFLYLRRQGADNLPGERRLWVIMAAALGSVIGARIVGSMENIPEWMASAHKLQYWYNNKTLVGGLLGGLFSVELVKKAIGEHSRTGDVFVYPLLLGMIIGRIGCFSAGVYEETYGLPTGLPWAMDLGDGIGRHPVALYEIVYLCLLWVLLALLQRRVQLQEGALFKLFLIGYLLFRLLLDFIKPGWRYFLNLGTIQLCCVAGLLYYYRYLLHPRLLLKR